MSQRMNWKKVAKDNQLRGSMSDVEYDSEVLKKSLTTYCIKCNKTHRLEGEVKWQRKWVVSGQYIYFCVQLTDHDRLGIAASEASKRLRELRNAKN